MMSWSWGVEFFFKASFIFLLSITFEDGGWELGSIGDGEAAAWDSRAGAPNAVWVGVALTFFTVVSFALFGGLSNLNVVIELHEGLWGSFFLNNWCLFFSITMEDSSWELCSITDGEATAWDSRACAPDAISIGIALTFFTMSSFALISSLSANFSDVVVEFFDGLWRSNLNNWSLLLLIAGEDSSWELGGIINSKATTWDSGASAPDAGWVGIAFAFFTVVSFALFGGFSTSQYSHEFVGRHLFLMLSHSLFMMLMHLLFSDMMNTMALVKGKET